MEKVFLIGGNGFVGKNLADYLKAYFEIHIIDKYIDEDFFSERPEIKTAKMDLVDCKMPDDYVDPDYILNLASIVTAERDMGLFDILISSNLKVLLNLYERYKDCKTLKLFIQFGSSEEYGNDGSPFVETMRESPTSPYALVKQLTVNTALMLHANYDFPAMAVRPGNVFGKYQPKSKFIPYVINQLRENSPIDVTPCEQKRDCIYAEDFAWCINGLLKNYEKAVGEIVNLGSGKSVALRDIIDFCHEQIQSTSVINYGALPYRANEVMDLCCSEEKLELIIGEPVSFNIQKRLKEYISTL